jgi:RNA-directed DNA polymerase
VKSDIGSFFTKIPRPLVVRVISAAFPEEDKFVDLVDKATNLEVENLAELEKKYGNDFKRLFIFDDVGTPQGCCLSPLFGNILLRDFDVAINKGDIVCLRYLDDFIILGPSLRAVNAAFLRAKAILKRLGLTAYDPAKDTTKASRGSIDHFEFLGIEFQGKNIRPSPKARKKLLDGIEDVIRESFKIDFSQIRNGAEEDRSVVKTLYLIHNKVKGWGNQYFFCNDKALWGSLDVEIDRRIGGYIGHCSKRLRSLDRVHKRRQLGVHLLIDSKSEPIAY